jgi:hypothetical protein
MSSAAPQGRRVRLPGCEKSRSARPVTVVTCALGRTECPQPAGLPAGFCLPGPVNNDADRLGAWRPWYLVRGWRGWRRPAAPWGGATMSCALCPLLVGQCPMAQQVCGASNFLYLLSARPRQPPLGGRRGALAGLMPHFNQSHWSHGLPQLGKAWSYSSVHGVLYCKDRSVCDR